jgi:hypothetical protein
MVLDASDEGRRPTSLFTKQREGMERQIGVFELYRPFTLPLLYLRHPFFTSSTQIFLDTPIFMFSISISHLATCKLLLCFEQ